MTLDEVLAVARLGAEAGCTEALFTLGEPDVVWGAQPLHRDMMLLRLLCYAAHMPCRTCACHATAVFFVSQDDHPKHHPAVFSCLVPPW